MDKATIQKLILEIAGNPTSGAVKDLAPKWAEAIEAELNPAKISRVEKDAKETRIIEVAEKR
jgi:hypothetical protein